MRWHTRVCSLPMEQAQPEQVAAWVQGHWGIENRLHWVRGVVFDEDRHQLRTANGPEIMAALRNLTTRPHPSGPRPRRRYRLHHQIPVTTTKTSHQTHHPAKHLTRLCRPPASGPLPVFGARVLGLFLCVRLTLTYLRHNLPQELLAEVYNVSQATVSRVISAYTPLIARALQTSVPTVEDLDPTAQLIIDGTLLECWSWKDHPELYSGKHKTTGLNVQVACTLSGALV